VHIPGIRAPEVCAFLQEVPGILDRLSRHEECKMAIDVDDSETVHYLHFKPKEFWEASGKAELADKNLPRPNFFPIVSSVLLAQAMLKRATGEGPTRGIQGFIIEFPTAGGHNAPPRGFRYDAVAKSHSLSLNEKGEPIYGPKDDVDLVKFKAASKGLPFYLAGYYARPEKLQEVLALGGAGVQVGTSFAFASESGLSDSAKQEVLSRIANNDLTVYTDPVASPTGFPFKVLELDGSLSEKENYAERPRVCNLGYLRTAYEKDGKIGYRCAAEPIDDWLKKGGDIQATEGRKCLCNGLMANAGIPQVPFSPPPVRPPSALTRHFPRCTWCVVLTFSESGLQVSPHKAKGSDERYVEETLITAGDDVNQVRKYMKQDANGRWEYSARDVVDYLLGKFKDEYLNELKLYKDADAAEDPKVKDALKAEKAKIEKKVADVDEQLAKK